MHEAPGVRTCRNRLRGRLAAAGRRARHILAPALLLACLSAAPAAADEPPDTPANRYLAAEEYLKIYPLDMMMADTTDELLKVIPPEQHEAFLESVKQVTKRLNLEELTIYAIVKHFTVQEINALTEFYSSPEGQSIMKKFPVYMKGIMPQFMSVFPEVISAVEEKMRG